MPSDNANAVELLRWLQQKISTMEKTLQAESSSPKSTNPKARAKNTPLDQHLAAELPILDIAVKELACQMQAFHVQAQMRYVNKWQMESQDDLHIHLLQRLWREFVELMSDLARWTKAQDDNDASYANLINIEALKVSITASYELESARKGIKWLRENRCYASYSPAA